MRSIRGTKIGDFERFFGDFAPEHRLILATYAGSMTQNAADEIVKQTCNWINEEELPLFVTDGRKYYAQSLGQILLY